ncbi:uncharacterized protein isoform X3 [Rhodnius prolixus]|uniref:uncharacterized protein isoform X2 n=1 Tax=Rhodnius prolixus TaxID=13249 RepID=UPI003D187F61
MKEMVGGCCVCSDDRGWTENPLVYCDGPFCTVAVHQACYGIVTVPTGNWYCRKCESQENCASPERSTKVRCELCPNKDGALKPTDNNAWAHVVCALYIPEVRFGNVTTMEPIILQQIPQERYNKTCYICDENNRSASRSTVGACMQCNKAGCRQTFHVTCAQAMGLLCEEAGNYMDNVKYCGYCHHHYTKIKKRGNVKVIPPYRPIGANDSPGGSPIKETEPVKTTSKRKLSSTSSGKSASKSATPVEEISLVNTFDTKTGGLSNQELSQNEDSSTSQTSQSATNGSKRRKGGARTPPKTNTAAIPRVSPDASPRPITPLTNSIGNAASIGNVMSGVVTATSAGQSIRPSSTGSMFGNSNTSSNSEKRQSGVVKEVRPNSILVNVPLDAAMMPNSPNFSATTGSTVNNIVGSTGVASASNIVSSIPPLISHVSALSPPISTSNLQNTSSEKGGSSLLSSQQQQPQQQQPVKRSSRSQSSEKGDKGRRSSKRSSNSGSGSSSSATSNSTNSIVNNCVPNNKPVSVSPPLQNSMSHNAAQPIIKLDEPHQSTPPPPPLTSSVQINNHINDVSNTSSNGSRGRRSNSSNSANVTVKEEKDIKIMQTAGLNAAHMLGNQLNPTSAMAQKMCDTLSQEMVAHSVFNSEPPTNHLVGPQLIKFQPPRLNNGGSGTSLSNGNGTSGSNSAVSAIAGSSSGGNNHGWGQTNMPQTLEQLLERQWEQGSQFLMEQAQHFDIASLLSCLHQLRAENHQLEEHVNSLIQRRDHLLAVNARLAIPLVPNVSSAPSGTERSGSGGGGAPNSVAQPNSANTPPGVVPSIQGAAIVENGLPDSPRHDYLPSAAPPPSSSMRQHRQQGGNSGGGQSQNSAGGYQPSQNSVLVRTTSVDPSRRSSHSPATSVFSSNSSSLYSHSTIAQSQQLAQQPQVVIRRDVISELSHHTGSVATSQPPTLVPANQSLGSGGGGSVGGTNTGGGNSAASGAGPPSIQSQQPPQQPVGVATRPS